MNIWVMNLKDDRENFEKPNDLSKFQFCLNNGIIGIGWGNEIDLPDAQKSKNHLDALNSLKAIKPGDLIWINGGNEYYIAVAKSEVKQANTDWHKYDIASYIECELRKIGGEIPEELEEYKDKLVAHSTIQHKPEDESFYQRFNDVYLKATKYDTKDSKKDIIKKNKGIIILFSLILLLLIGLICVSNIEDKNSSKTESKEVSAQSTEEPKDNTKTNEESMPTDI